MRIEIFQSFNKQWVWHFIQRNGQIISHSETFPTLPNARRSAKNAVRAIIRGMVRTRDTVAVPTFYERYERKDSGGRIVITLTWLTDAVQ